MKDSQLRKLVRQEITKRLDNLQETPTVKEIDFKSHSAYKKYKTKHKMRPTTKVSIGGKETTAADADKVIAKKAAASAGAPKTNQKSLDKLAKVGMKSKAKNVDDYVSKTPDGDFYIDSEDMETGKKVAKAGEEVTFTKDGIEYTGTVADEGSGGGTQGRDDGVTKLNNVSAKTGGPEAGSKEMPLSQWADDKSDYEATYAKAAKKYTDAKVAAVAKEYKAKPATINPRSGLSDQSIKKIQKNMAGGIYKNDYEDYDKEWLNHKLNVQGPVDPNAHFKNYDFMPHDFSGSESSAEGILTGLDTLMNQSSLERPYIHHTFSQMTKEQAHAGLDALKKKYSYDEDKIVKGRRDPQTKEYTPGNKHWRNHFETNFGKVKKYERALEEFENPLEPEGIKHYSDKIKKAKRPDFMAMAVAGAGKYKPSETSEITEDLKVKARKDKEMGSSLGYRLTEPQNKKMLAFLKKNRSNPHVKKLLGTLGQKYSDSVSITLDNRPFFVYASYGKLRIGHGGAVSRWNDNMKKALTKYIGEGKLKIQENLSTSDQRKATETIKKYVKKLGSKADGEVVDVAFNIAKILRWDDRKRAQLTSYLYKLNKGSDQIIFGEGKIKVEGKLNEAPMDKRFQREWERNCKVLLTHLKHEYKNRRNDRTESAEISDFISIIEDAMKVPAEMAEIVGMQEGKLTEGKTRLDEKFASRKLSAIFGPMARNKWNPSREFLRSMASQYKIQWDKLTDDMITGPDKKLDRKGIDLVIASKDVAIPGSGRWGWTTNIKKGQLLSVAINGKRVWVGRGIRTGQGRQRSFIGLDKRGYANIRSILNIDGAVVYHIDPAQQARGAGDVRDARADAKAGATALISAKEMKQQNRTRYMKALQIQAGKAGKGPIVKMLETATKMYEAALQEKLTKMKQGFIPRDSWYADTLKTISNRYQYMVRAFEEYMKAGANIEAVKAKYKDDPETGKYSIKYEENTMASKAKEVKDEFNKMKRELAKLNKAEQYIDVKTLGRAY